MSEMQDRWRELAAEHELDGRPSWGWWDTCRFVGVCALLVVVVPLLVYWALQAVSALF